MVPISTEPIRKCHVVAVPYPGRGHVNPMMNICKLIASKFDPDRLVITFVVTEEWLGLIGSEIKPANVRFAAIPNVVPSERVRAADMVGFVTAVMTKMEQPFEEVLDRMQSPASVIIADTFLRWAVEVGNRRSIPVASLWTMPAMVFSVFYNFELVVENGQFPIELCERGEERVDYLPGIPSIRLSDLPTIIHRRDQNLLRLCLTAFANVSRARYLLFTTCSDLEPQVIAALKTQFPFPLYCLGPTIPYFNLQQPPPITPNHHDYLKWLDSKPPNSVLYVSLGSFLSVSTSQMDEIEAGLGGSGVNYLWVNRGHAGGVGGGGRMVVRWCDQLRVLCHPSVGGFWTHCGWNSTMEGIYAGKPMLTLPILMDQVPNSKCVVEDWKIGWEVKREEGNLVSREKIVEVVRRFMDEGSEEREEMMRRAEELRRLCRTALVRGGSSHENLQAFVDGIAKF